MKYILNNDNLEVVGKQYLQGVGGYDGTNPDTSSDIATYLPNMVNITYLDLKNLREVGKLVPGQQYRITDYITTTIQENTQSAGHQFDLIVTASNESTLNEVARAIQHDGDTYFADSDLNAWQLWYCLDNDTSRFAWADTTNGKGVIYRMIDEFGNDCPYDFKNIQFVRYKLNAPDEYIAEGNDDKWVESLSKNIRAMFNVGAKSYIWSGLTDDDKYWEDALCVLFSSPTGETKAFYTFSTDSDEDASLLDSCYDNKMMFSKDLPNNVFFGNSCNYNSFGNNCTSNSFGNECESNSFGNDCHYNSFGNYCYSNSFGNNCYSNSFRVSGDNTSSLISYCRYNVFDDGCSNNIIYSANTNASNYLENYHINRGVKGTDSNPMLIDAQYLNAENVCNVYKKGDVAVVAYIQY